MRERSARLPCDHYCSGLSFLSSFISISESSIDRECHTETATDFLIIRPERRISVILFLFNQCALLALGIVRESNQRRSSPNVSGNDLSGFVLSSFTSRPGFLWSFLFL